MKTVDELMALAGEWVSSAINFHLGKETQPHLARAALLTALQEVAQPVAQPLTIEQIDASWRSVDYTQPYDDFRIAIARAVELAHGIGGDR